MTQENAIIHPSFWVLWGKHKGGFSLLLQHLLDTAAVGEVIWDKFLAPTVRAKIDACCEGQGRKLFSLMCGLHDIGKATPAFQSQVKEMISKLKATGLDWETLPENDRKKWRHELAGAMILRRVFPKFGWGVQTAIAWTWPLIAGHHGVIPSKGKIWYGTRRGPALGHAQGLGEWLVIQDILVCRVAAELGIDLAKLNPTMTPTRAIQLAFSGLIIMADWIASSDEEFPGVADLSDVTIDSARQRVNSAWQKLDLHGGWMPENLPILLDLIQTRFGLPPRPVQTIAIELAEAMSTPGLMIIEAPMGEGKTEAALAAAEILARRFGADGIYIGMPTQATSDSMYSRVRSWIKSVAPQVKVGLLHGKRGFNEEWNALRSRAYYNTDECCESAGTPSSWLLGRKRGLLIPVTVGSIDNLLCAGTRTKHVMLRHAGLVGRVVILDEVHACDIYMLQFLTETLRWLADAGVPVVLLSATLPPKMRAELVKAYMQGAQRNSRVDVSGLPDITGYPSVLAVNVVDDVAQYALRTSVPWRPSVPVQVEILDEPLQWSASPVVDVLKDALKEGGTALVICNTVKRAQQMYLAAKVVFGADTVLLHSRLTMRERAKRTAVVLDQLGPPGRADARSRPNRLVVISTQIAEQSFDVDVDLMITDLTSIDLLLQRIGRLHRHERAEDARPLAVRIPRVVVTGLSRDATGGPPRFPGGAKKIYGEHSLLRSAALVCAAEHSGWSVPADVPELVRQGYGDLPIVPVSWMSTALAAEVAWKIQQDIREANARSYLLSGESNVSASTLNGLHDCLTATGVAGTPDDDVVMPLVRDGGDSVEVVLVRLVGQEYLTLDGQSLGIDGSTALDSRRVKTGVLDATVRLPSWLSDAARKDHARGILGPLPGWKGDAWLERTWALILDGNMSSPLGAKMVSYDQEIGLETN